MEWQTEIQHRQPVGDARLDQASCIKLGFPHDFIEHGRHFAHGRTFDLVDDHRHPR